MKQRRKHIGNFMEDIMSTNSLFAACMKDLQRETHAVSKKKGLEKHINNPLYIAAKLALIMSEAVEALEWDRAGKKKEIGHDLADIVIRTMDLAQALNIDLGAEIIKKHTINISRAKKKSKSRY